MLERYGIVCGGGGGAYSRDDAEEDPDFLEQRHIDMALERAESDLTPLPPPPPTKTVDIGWHQSLSAELQARLARGGSTIARPIHHDKSSLLVSSQEIQATLRHERRYSGAKRLTGNGAAVLRVTSLQPPAERRTVTEVESAALRDVAIANSSFAHVRRALAKKTAAATPKRFSAPSLASPMPQQDFIVVDYKPGNAGFFDWTKPIPASRSKVQHQQRYKVLRSSNTTRSKRAPSSTTSNHYSVAPPRGEESFLPTTTKCELSIRLPSVSLSHRSSSTTHSARRSTSKISNASSEDPPTPNDQAGANGAGPSHGGQMVFNKCSDLPHHVLSKGFPKALQL